MAGTGQSAGPSGAFASCVPTPVATPVGAFVEGQSTTSLAAASADSHNATVGAPAMGAAAAAAASVIARSLAGAGAVPDKTPVSPSTLFALKTKLARRRPTTLQWSSPAPVSDPNRSSLRSGMMTPPLPLTPTTESLPPFVSLLRCLPHLDSGAAPGVSAADAAAVAAETPPPLEQVWHEF